MKMPSKKAVDISICCINNLHMEQKKMFKMGQTCIYTAYFMERANTSTLGYQTHPS